MPGPSNGRKRRKSQGKSVKKRGIVNNWSQAGNASLDLEITHTNTSESSSSPSPIQTPISQIEGQGTHSVDSVQIQDETSQLEYEEGTYLADSAEKAREGDFSRILLQEPYIHDPGSGIRVRDTRAFLASRYFSQPPALDNALCAEFAQEEVLQMLKTVLPEELALILWYNKSRATSRICPACQRLYHVGDVLPDQVLTGDTKAEKSSRTPPPSELKREQDISGICSSMCFILASFEQCNALTTKAAWGHTANEMDEGSWAILNGASSLVKDGRSTSKALVMLVRMTRLDDLGLAQLCFPDVDWGTEGAEGAAREGF